MVLPVVYMQGASIFTMGRWGVGLPYDFLECDLYCLVAKTNLTPACGYNGKNRMEMNCSVLNMALVSTPPSQTAQNVTSAHAQRSNLRKSFRTPLQIWSVVGISDLAGTVLRTGFLKRAVHVLSLRLSFLSFHVIGPRAVQSSSGRVLAS